MKWTNNEIAFLQKNYGYGKMTCAELSSEMGRSKNGIYTYVYENRDKLRLPLGVGYWDRGTFDKTPSLTLAYILGVLYGDGWVCRSLRQYGGFRHRIGLNAKDREFVECFRAALTQIGLHSSRVYTRKDKKHESWSTQFLVCAYSKPFCKWFKSLALDDVYKLLQTAEMKREFIRGFYESEGSLNKSKGYFRLTITNTNLELLRIMRQILKELGFCFYLYSHNQRPKDWAAIHYLGIFKPNDIKRFLAEIDPCIPRKSLTRLENDTYSVVHK